MLCLSMVKCANAGHLQRYIATPCQKIYQPNRYHKIRSMMLRRYMAITNTQYIKPKNFNGNYFHHGDYFLSLSRLVVFDRSHCTYTHTHPRKITTQWTSQLNTLLWQMHIIKSCRMHFLEDALSHRK